MPEVKLLRRIVSLGTPRGAVIEVSDEKAADFVRRGVGVLYTKKQRDADMAAESAAQARMQADADEKQAMEAAAKQAEKEREKHLRMAARTPAAKAPERKTVQSPATAGGA